MPDAQSVSQSVSQSVITQKPSLLIERLSMYVTYMGSRFFAGVNPEMPP